MRSTGDEGRSHREISRDILLARLQDDPGELEMLCGVLEDPGRPGWLREEAAEAIADLGAEPVRLRLQALQQGPHREYAERALGVWVAPERWPFEEALERGMDDAGFLAWAGLIEAVTRPETVLLLRPLASDDDRPGLVRHEAGRLLESFPRGRCCDTGEPGN